MAERAAEKDKIFNARISLGSLNSSGRTNIESKDVLKKAAGLKLEIESEAGDKPRVKSNNKSGSFKNMVESVLESSE